MRSPIFIYIMKWFLIRFVRKLNERGILVVILND